MSHSKGFTATRRSVLMAGGAAVGVAALGLPRAAFAAPGPRPAVSTPAGQAALRLYEQAVGLMKDPAINQVPQPHSWTFQAYIHSLAIEPRNPNSGGYRNGSPAFKAKIDSIYGINPVGPAAQWKQAALACWSTCPHGSPFFLSWHRWYVFYLEQACRTVLKNPDFVLPYWDYASNSGNSLQLPGAFYQNAGSALYESIRGQGWTAPTGQATQTLAMNSGGFMRYSNIQYIDSLTARVFFPADVNAFAVPPSPQYFSFGYTGRTETQPHDNVHDGVGGLMGNVPTAAADPIFYLHHCQIDHLWASWQSYAGSTMNYAPTGQGTPAQPDQPTWTGQTFSFVDGTGSLIRVRSGTALDYRALGYSYDSLVPQPAAPPVAMASAGSGQAAAPGALAGALAAGSASGIKVGAGRTALLSSTVASTPAAPADAAKGAAAPAAAAPGTLVLQDVALVKRPPAALHVFANLPESAPADITGPYYVGTLNLFKLEVPGADGGHAAHGGGTFAFDLSKALDAQQKAGTWKGGPVSISIDQAGATDNSGAQYLTIGKVELRR